MKIRIWLCVAFLLCSLPAFSQEGSGAVRGVVYGPQGETVSYTWIRAVDTTTSKELGRNESTTEGRYEIRGLSPGTYVLEAGPGCCAYKDFESDPISLENGQTLEFDFHLEEGISFNTVGDDPWVIASALRAEAVIPDEPPPRMPGGKPDLSGVWLRGSDPFPEERQALPWAEELVEKRREEGGVGSPHNQCLPGNPPTPTSAAPFMAKFVQTDELIVILFEDYPGFRQVYLDGRKHPEYPNPSWVGHSIGHWEDDTLVIDTIGYNDRGWVSGMHPRSEELHIVERYSRPEYGRIELEYTVEDPKVFEKPFKRIQSYYLVPHVGLIEFVCENNKWAGLSDESATYSQD
jgi:hypothetical protein